MALVPTHSLYLRYALLLVLDGRRGWPCTVDDLLDGLASVGLCPDGGARPGKVVSDALRWEVARGRAVRLGRGRYAIGHLPAVTRHRARRVVGCLVRGERPPLAP